MIMSDYEKTEPFTKLVRPGFSQKIPHFIKNHKLRLMKFQNLKDYLNLVWDIKTSFGPLRPKTLIKP